MSFLPINDIKLYYEVQGTGIPIIFIHAGITDSRMWNEQVKHFSKSFKVVTYDLRGYGQSTVSKTQFNHTQDLKILLDTLLISKAHFIACSFACQILFDVVLEYPSVALSLTLVNGRYFGYKSEKADPPPLEQNIIQAYENNNLDKIAELETLIWFVGRKRSKEEVDKKIFDKVVEMNTIALKNELTISPADKMLHLDAKDKIEIIKVPTCYIIGLLDEPNMVKSCELIANQLNSKVYYMENCAHLPNLEQPNTFNNYLETFLNSIKEIF